jgi:sodium-dependent dicarboxylate transporter 2/3/5
MLLSSSRSRGSSLPSLLLVLLGPAAGLAAWALLGGADAAGTTLTPAGRATVAIGVWMAVWWITEAVPLAVASLLPIVLFPLAGVASVAQAAAPYASPLVFLFLGGFLIGLAVERSGLHRRLALMLLLAIGTQPPRLVAGFMLATALISMWISNTATAMMMLPIGKSVLDAMRERLGPQPDPATERAFTQFAAALMLGIGYAASIGGIGTLVGTPPNMIFAGFVQKQYGAEITMAGWMKIGVPLMLLLLPLAWVLLVKVVCPFGALTIPGARPLLREELSRLGRATTAERVVGGVFAATAIAWILQPQLAAWTGIPELSDTVIAMTAALLLFVIPLGAGPTPFALDWETAKRVPWDILILFGGGLSLAAAIGATGVDRLMAGALAGLGTLAPFVFLLALAAGITLLSEIASNTALATMMMPVLAAGAAATGAPPEQLLALAALAASCGFMLPVATPPNAIVYGSGYVPLRSMLKAGAWLDVTAVLLIAAFVAAGGYPRF